MIQYYSRYENYREASKLKQNTRPTGGQLSNIFVSRRCPRVLTTASSVYGAASRPEVSMASHREYHLVCCRYSKMKRRPLAVRLHVGKCHATQKKGMAMVPSSFKSPLLLVHGAPSVNRCSLIAVLMNVP